MQAEPFSLRYLFLRLEVKPVWDIQVIQVMHTGKTYLDFTYC